MNPQIEIKSPCHENWSEMKLNINDRFCLSCNQTVIDFTNKNTDEITDILKSIGNDSACGKFNVLDVKTNNHLDTFLWKLNVKGFRYLALVLFSVLLLTGCRTKKHRMGRVNTKHGRFKSYTPNF